MKFEYNGHLPEEKRINQVAMEITSKYPDISMQTAKEIAMFEGRISTPKTANMELRRLYYIMLVNQTNKKSNIIVFRDYLNVLKNNYDASIKDKYFDIIDKIKNYFDNNASFPFIDYE
jgi:hypothetical protein